MRARDGGYMELNGFDKEVMDQLYKLASVGLCPNLSGQIVMGLVMQPPEAGTSPTRCTKRSATISSPPPSAAPRRSWTASTRWRA